jgi:hypothetical protein
MYFRIGVEDYPRTRWVFNYKLIDESYKVNHMIMCTGKVEYHNSFVTVAKHCNFLYITMCFNSLTGGC